MDADNAPDPAFAKLLEVIEAAGGGISQQEGFVRLGDTFPDVLATVMHLRESLENLIRAEGRDVTFGLLLTNSESFGSSVQRAAPGMYAIFIPIGLPARLRVLSRLLLTYWGSEFHPRVIRSALDDMIGDDDMIPERLRPLFLEEGLEDFWGSLQALDLSIDIPTEAEYDARSVASLALQFIVCHEFAHIIHGHFDRIGQPVPGLPSEMSGRALEADADTTAMALSLQIQLQSIRKAIEDGQEQSFAIGFLRQTYAVTMVFAVSDAKRKYFGSFDGSSYEHPMVRLETVLDVPQRYRLFSPELFELYKKNADLGWTNCLWALENLSMDGLLGKYGPSRSETPGPLHMLGYSATTQGPTNRDMVRRVEVNLICADLLRAALDWRLPALRLDENFARTLRLPEPPARVKVGVWGVPEGFLTQLTLHYGADQVNAADFVAKEGADNEMDFVEALEKIKLGCQHALVVMSGLESLTVMSGCMVELNKGNLTSICLVGDGAFKEMLSSMFKNMATIARQSTLEELETSQQVLLLPELDFERFVDFVERPRNTH